jgi:hypothetical protein
MDLLFGRSLPGESVSSARLKSLEEELHKIRSQGAEQQERNARDIESLEDALTQYMHRESEATSACAAKVGDLTTLQVAQRLADVEPSAAPAMDGIHAMLEAERKLGKELVSLQTDERQRQVGFSDES